MAPGNNGQEVSHRYNHGATGGGKKNISVAYLLTLRTAGVLGDRKAMNLDSDEDEEELALKV